MMHGWARLVADSQIFYVDVHSGTTVSAMGSSVNWVSSSLPAIAQKYTPHNIANRVNAKISRCVKLLNNKECCFIVCWDFQAA